MDHKFSKLIKKHTVISFDLFDTLLLRTTADPSGVFLILWDRILSSNLNLTDLSREEFRKIRIEAERRAKNNAHGKEIMLTDIYNQIPNFIFTDKQKAMLIELETEKSCCYCNNDIYQVALSAFQQGKDLVILSDMYLTQEQITKLLISCGIQINIFKHIIISCQEKCSKQSGILYQSLLKKYPHIAPNSILHIGDNYNGDYIQALNNGIDTYYYDVIPDKLYSIFDYEKLRHNQPQIELLSLRKLAVSHYDGLEMYRTAYEIGAAIVGPFLSLYITHVCNRLEALRINAIYPFMREGWLLGKMLQTEVADRNLTIHIHPIYISRKVTYLPSITKITYEVLEDVIGTRNLTIEEAIDFAGIPKSSFNELKNFFSLLLKESHKFFFCGSTVREYFLNRLLEPKHIKIIEDKIHHERQLLIAYLKQEIQDFENIATIDIGFFGRIQMWLEKSLDFANIQHKIKHFLAIGLTGEKIFDDINFEGYCGTFAENNDLISTIHRTTDIVEKLISVTTGSTIGYQKENGSIIPLTDRQLSHKNFTDIVFSGILEFQKLWLTFRKKKPDTAMQCVLDRRGALCLLHRLIDMPRLEEVKALMTVEADTNFATNYRKQIISNENLQLIQKKGIEYVDRCNISYTYENNCIVWPKGLVTLYDKYYYVRRTLRNNAGNEIIHSMLEVIEQVKKANVQEVVLYGAGENGRQFLFLCELYHIKVTYFVDRKKSLWGTQKEGISIISIEEAINKGNCTYVITSLFSISEIKANIIKSATNKRKEYKIFHV